MINIQIPAPDFNFDDVVKRKADKIIKDKLSINEFISPYAKSISQKHELIKTELLELSTKNSKLIYLLELLNHHIKIKIKYNEDRINFPPRNIMGAQKREAEVLERIDDMKFFLYQLMDETCNYSFDRNTFSDDEVSGLDRKINAILVKLDEIQVANEVIFNEVEELKIKLKEDFESLKSDYPLGRKRWYQRAAGVVVSYAGTKVADEIFDQLKPLLHDFFMNTAPHLIDKL